MHKIIFNEKDFGTVFGVPCGEYDIFGPEAQIGNAGVESIRSMIGLSPSKPNSFKSLEHILEEELDRSETKMQIERFKIAFVVFVMGHLLTPSAKYDYSSIDYWGALKNADFIGRFNWGRYIINHLLTGAPKVRDEIEKKNSVVRLRGCHLFLQVLYLDNVDLGRLNKPHSKLPRIQDFDSATLNNMIISLYESSDDSFRSFVTLRSPMSSCYMRYSLQSPYKVTYTDQVGQQSPVRQQQVNQLTADSFMFREPNDLFTYLRLRYPELTNCRAFDKLKSHNAKQCFLATQMRTEIIRQNAKLADWMVQSIGRERLMEDMLRTSVLYNKPRGQDEKTGLSGAGSSRSTNATEGRGDNSATSRRQRNNLEFVEPPSFDLGDFGASTARQVATPHQHRVSNPINASPVRAMQPFCSFSFASTNNDIAKWKASTLESPRFTSSSAARNSAECLYV